MVASFRPSWAPIQARRKPSPRRRRLLVEQLEDRRLLSGEPVLVKDINPGPASSDVGSTTASIGKTLYFAANDGTHGAELWKSDGSAAGTVMVKDINPGSAGSYPSFGSTIASRYPSFGVLKGKLYFAANDGIHGSELWKTDGTAAGTVMVADINPGPSGSYPTYFMNVKGQILFTANDGTHGRELWKTDGTAAGTVLVKDINPGSADSNIDFPASIDGTLYFEATDGVHGSELWKSDGTAAGTVMVADINPGPGNSFPAYFREVNGQILFTANDGTHGEELWKTDGTAAGTVMVKDINPGPNSSIPSSFLVIGKTLYFSATDGTHGFQLWKTDGTAAGTVMLTHTTNGNPGPRNPVNLDGSLLFEEYDEAGGIRLGISDGTVAGTRFFTDIKAGNDRPVVEDMVAVGDLAYFQADDGKHGLELWQTDGTDKGTKLTQDLFKGPQSSMPTALTNVKGTLYFYADDGVHGRELFKIAPHSKTSASDLAASASPVDTSLASPGSTLINAFLPPAPAPVLPVVGPPVTTPKQAMPLSVGSGGIAAVFTSLTGPPAGAASGPVPDGMDGLEVGAIDALFASLYYQDCHGFAQGFQNLWHFPGMTPDDEEADLLPAEGH